jgi:ankyrin repeat protein
MYAVEYNDDDMINFLLDNGAKFDATNNYGHTTLMYAILHDKIDQVKLLISKGADVTKKSSEDQTTLMYAIHSSNNIDIVELLLDKITDETQRIEFINQVGTYYSALMYAVTYNDFDMVKLLLENGANPNIISKYGNTALNSAIMFSNEKYYYYNKEKYNIATHEMTNQIVTLLLNYGADPNLKDNDRKTALIHAVEYPTKYTNPVYYYKEDPGNAYSKIVQVLLKYGADPNLKDNVRKTALDYAKPDSYISRLLTPKRKGGSTKSRRLKTKKTVKKYRKKPQN